MTDLTWTTEKRKINDLKPFDRNPRQLTEKQAKDLKTSLEKFNLVEIPAIDTDNRIIAGHMRVSIMRSLGKTDEIDVRVPNRKLTDKEFEEYNIRSNKNTGEWDLDLLSGFDEDFLKDIGFDSKELDRIFQVDSAPEDDDVPDSRPKTDIKLVDIFQLGEHRVMCGDATKREDVEKLMQGKKADMVFTDPPYGINIVKVGGGGKTHFGKVGGDKWVHANYYVPVQNDDKEFDPSFLLKLADKILLFGGNYYANLLENSGCWLCWDKTGENYIQNNFADCEFVWTNLKKPSRVYRCKWRGLLKEKGEDLRRRVHPTQKPIKLLLDILNDYSETYEYILDLFGGSGSTLIACEKLNRKCRMMEIDPVYVQVIIDRWEKFTGQKAIRCD